MGKKELGLYSTPAPTPMESILKSYAVALRASDQTLSGAKPIVGHKALNAYGVTAIMEAILACETRKQPVTAPSTEENAI